MQLERDGELHWYSDGGRGGGGGGDDDDEEEEQEHVSAMGEVEPRNKVRRVLAPIVRLNRTAHQDARHPRSDERFIEALFLFEMTR